MKKKKLLIAGGGTGGHIMAGIAVIEAWKEKYGSDASVLFIGGERGLEGRIVPSHGIELKRLKVAALKGKTGLSLIQSLLLLPYAFFQSMVWVIQFRPTATLGVGGYASGPCVLVASLFQWLWGGKSALLEQNTVSGLTNRILGKWVGLIFSAFSEAKGLPQNKLIISGNPTRKNFEELPKSEGDFRVFVFGGSQGAVGMNTVVMNAIRQAKDLDILWTHQTGERDYDRVFQFYQSQGIEAEVSPFIEDMKKEYQRASVVICRSGASTLSELAIVGRTAIFIPFPQASDQHQLKNAENFVKSKAAWCIEEGPDAAQKLCNLLLELKKSPEQIEERANQIKSFAPHRATEIIVKELSK